MTEENIKIGVELAREALYFAIFSNGKVTCDECRVAIKILFGEEVDAALQNDFALKAVSNAELSG